MYRTRGVVIADPAVASLEVGAHARLVAHAPDDDRRMVLVAQHHAAVALQMRLGEDGVLGQRLVAVTHSVRLDVTLVQHIDSVLVAEVVPLGSVGVVAGAHGVHVELLHEADILNHALARHDESFLRVDLVAVGALDEHGLAVDQKLSVADLRRAESHALRHGFGHAAAVVYGNRQFIELGSLGRPFGGVLDLQRQVRLAVARRRHALGHHGALLVEQFHVGALDARREVHVDVHDGILVLGVEHGGGFHVEQTGLGTRREVYIARNAAQTPQVLILQIGSVAPAEDLQGDEVLAGLNELGDVERRAEVAVLGVADEFAVDPYVNVRHRRADVEEYFAARPVGGDVHRAAIRSHVVLLDGHVGRVVAEVVAPRVTHVDIDRIAVTVQLPHGGHLHRVPRGVVVVGAVEIGGTPVGVLHPVELPSAVERDAIGIILVAVFARGGVGRVEDLVGRVHGRAVDLVHFGVVPLGEGLSVRRRSGQSRQ